MLECLLPAAAGSGGTFWMPENASTIASEIDSAYYLIYYISVFFFALVIGAMVFLGFRYRRRGAKPGPTIPLEGNIKLEIVWSVIPAAIAVGIFVMGFRGFMALAVPPGNAMNINVRAQTWSWSFSYPGLAGTSPHLYVPINRPVKLTMSSNDVLHSLFIPAFRVKQDVLPNRYTTLWFEATQLSPLGEDGERVGFDLFCTEYCGLEHSLMTTPKHNVYVLSEPDFDRWVANGGPLGESRAALARGEVTAEKVGALLFESKGCTSCHNMEGEPKVGPTLGGLYGATENTNAGPVVVDENYLVESIREPAAKIVSGYPNQMPAFDASNITPEELDWIIAYLKNPQLAKPE